MERTKGERVSSSPLFQHAIVLEIEDTLAKHSGLVPFDTIAELLVSLHTVGSFSFVLYFREVRSMLSKGDPKGKVHFGVVESLPETADRSAVLQRRGLMKRWRGQAKVCDRLGVPKPSSSDPFFFLPFRFM